MLRDPLAPLRWDVLQNDMRMYEIKRARYASQIVVPTYELDVGDLSLRAVFLRLHEHGFRDVYADHMWASLGERYDHASDTAAELQRTCRPKAGSEIRVDEPEYVIALLFA